ncbi:hypothetical protein LIER_39773 [Lithospermum erythrorhizon]|uniref:Uncharacterized protein n=1 Tax=Lithospermum erythrorhizon TaxID=34254 RepID=A0AAV3QMN6_LITER
MRFLTTTNRGSNPCILEARPHIDNQSCEVVETTSPTTEVMQPVIPSNPSVETMEVGTLASLPASTDLSASLEQRTR